MALLFQHTEPAAAPRRSLQVNPKLLLILVVSVLGSCIACIISVLVTSDQVKKAFQEAEHRRESATMAAAFIPIFTNSLNMAGAIEGMRAGFVDSTGKQLYNWLSPYWIPALTVGMQAVTGDYSNPYRLASAMIAGAVTVNVSTPEALMAYRKSRGIRGNITVSTSSNNNNINRTDVSKLGVYIDLLVGPLAPAGFRTPYFISPELSSLSSIRDGEYVNLGLSSPDLPQLNSLIALGIGTGQAFLILFDQVALWRTAKANWNEETTTVRLCAQNNTGGWVEPCEDGEAILASRGQEGTWIDQVADKPLNWTVVGVHAELPFEALDIALASVCLSVSITIGVAVCFLIIAGIAAHQWQRSAAKVQGSVEAQERFMALTSHDMRTPIQIISSAATLGTTIDNMEEVQELLNFIQPAATVLAYGMQNIMDAHVESIKLSISSCDLRKVVLGAMNLVRVTAEVSPAVQVTVDVPEQVPLVLADGQRIRRCVMHLLTNAFEHTKKGTVKLSLQITRENDSNNEATKAASAPPTPGVFRFISNSGSNSRNGSNSTSRNGSSNNSPRGSNFFSRFAPHQHHSPTHRNRVSPKRESPPSNSREAQRNALSELTSNLSQFYSSIEMDLESGVVHNNHEFALSSPAIPASPNSGTAAAGGAARRTTFVGSDRGHSVDHAESVSLTAAAAAVVAAAAAAAAASSSSSSATSSSAATRPRPTLILPERSSVDIPPISCDSVDDHNDIEHQQQHPSPSYLLVTIRVEDTGIGISPLILKQISSKRASALHRGSGGWRGGREGEGAEGSLGIVKAILEAMESELEMESKVDEKQSGTKATIQLRLPLAPPGSIPRRPSFAINAHTPLHETFIPLWSCAASITSSTSTSGEEPAVANVELTSSFRSINLEDTPFDETPEAILHIRIPSESADSAAGAGIGTYLSSG